MTYRRHPIASGVLAAIGCWAGAFVSVGASPAAAGTSYSQVAAGHLHSCAITVGGTVKCWGWNGYGQLGNNAAADSAIPVAVQGVTGATAITTGLGHSCAIVTNGAIKYWGSNYLEQLGNNTTTDSTIPVDVQGFSGAIAISFGDSAPRSALCRRMGSQCH